jgi:DNA (cytosine-5)-methyltransferase 1
MRVEVYSFFSGLGFLDLGFEKAGFNIVFVNEFNKDFLQAYQYARRESDRIPVYGYSNEDIRKYLDTRVWNRVFHDYNNREERLIGFIGGPPCPDFSAGGKNAGSRNNFKG